MDDKERLDRIDAILDRLTERHDRLTEIKARSNRPYRPESTGSLTASPYLKIRFSKSFW
jgi:hypothetical protein